jgi:glutamine synthetase
MQLDLEKRGWKYNTGPEPEFFLFERNGDIYPVPYDVGGYFDFSSDDRAAQVRNELMDALNSMGLEVEVGHHEVALGQHEIDFRFADAVRTADNVLTLKYTVKAIAAQHDLIASFMPKPIFGINGSGMHTHQSIFDQNGKNLFYDETDQLHLSELAYGFIAGQLKHARALSALVAPTVNSYKRLVPGYEAPVYIGWAQINRSALIRIPRYTAGKHNAMRAELRFPDPSCNPYLAFAAMLGAALDGIDNNLQTPKPLNNVNVYNLSEEERKAKNIKELPGSLLEALTELSKDMVLRDTLGEEIFSTFMRAKREEWEEYRVRVTDWEVEKFLESA